MHFLCLGKHLFFFIYHHLNESIYLKIIQVCPRCQIIGVSMHRTNEGTVSKVLNYDHEQMFYFGFIWELQSGQLERFSVIFCFSIIVRSLLVNNKEDICCLANIEKLIYFCKKGESKNVVKKIKLAEIREIAFS